MSHRIGVVGCGIVAQRHMNAISSSNGRWELVAVADIDRARAEESAKRWGAKAAYTDYQELLAKSELDALLVATHAETHAPITIAAFERGLHVLCEKPMAANAEECEAMVAAAAKADRLLSLNFNTRSGHAYREIKRHIDEGALGKVRVVRFVYDWSNHHWTPPERLHNFMLNGGPIIDSGVHFFEGVRWFTGAEFERIEANGVVIPPYDHPQHVVTTCKMTDGSIALVEAGWLYCKKTRDAGSLFQVTAIGDEGTADFDYGRGTVKVYTADNTYESPRIDVDKHFDTVYDLFARSLEEGRLVELASGEDGLRATEAAYAALASAHASAGVSTASLAASPHGTSSCS